MEPLQQNQDKLHESMVDLAKKYSEPKLNPYTEGYDLHVRKKVQSFNAYDLEEAFEEGQKNPKWTYSGNGEDPKEGVKYLVDDMYTGTQIAIYNEKEDKWICEDGEELFRVDRWIIIPV